MTPWREWFAPQREKILESKKRTAQFLIAAYVAIRIKAALFGFVIVRLVLSREEGEPSEPLNWTWMRELFLDAQTFIDLNLLTSLALCVFITAWLFQLSLRDALVRLGLRRPTAREVLLAALATGSCLALAVLTGWALFGDDLSVGSGLLPLTIGRYLVGPLGMPLSLGFLYRGLVVEANWSHARSLVTLLVLVVLFRCVRHLRYWGFEDFMLTAPLALGIVVASTALCVGYLRRAQFRLGALVLLTLGTTIAEVSTETEASSPGYLLWLCSFSLAPYTLLVVLNLAWTAPSSETASLTPKKGSA